MTRLGMDVDVVEQAGVMLHQQAARLVDLVGQIDRLVHQVQGTWLGSRSRRLVDVDWPRSRALLRQAAEEVEGLGTSARNNARDQRTVSSQGSAPGAPGWISSRTAPVAGLGALGILGQSLRQSAGYTSPFSQGIGLIGVMAENREFGSASKGIGRTADIIGKPLGAFSVATSGYSAVEAAAQGRWGDAGVHGLDGTADALKMTPVGRPFGIAVQTWSEVAKEAQQVDWSPQGMRYLREASLSDWADALNDAVVQTFWKVPKILL